MGAKKVKGGSKGGSSSGPTRAAEQRLWAQGFKAVAGVDEAGRGPLAGPVVAAAAVLPPGVTFDRLNDSKQMSEAEREEVYRQLTTHPDVAWAV
jgi:ribonuclease HII